MQMDFKGEQEFFRRVFRLAGGMLVRDSTKVHFSLIEYTFRVLLKEIKETSGHAC